MNESPLQDAEDLTALDTSGPRRPPFMFAKRHGVLVAGEEGGKVVVIHTANIDPVAVVELRRLMGQPLKLQLVDQEQFDSQLAPNTSPSRKICSRVRMMHPLSVSSTHC
jgi:hypothetical protein